MGDDLYVVVCNNTDKFVNRLNREGIERVYAVSYGDTFNYDISVWVVEALFDEFGPTFCLSSISVNGLNASAVAQALDLNYVSVAVGLEYKNGTLSVARMVWELG